MKPLSWPGMLAATLLLLAACGDRTQPAPAAAPAAESTSPSVAPAPSAQAVTPASPGTGPAAGGTAIGGMVAGQEQGRASKGGAPEPTGGDGAPHGAASAAK